MKRENKVNNKRERIYQKVYTIPIKREIWYRKLSFIYITYDFLVD